MSKLPKSLYIKIEQDGDDEFFIANEDLYDIAEKGETIKVGIYKLQSVKTVRMLVETKEKDD